MNESTRPSHRLAQTDRKSARPSKVSNKPPLSPVRWAALIGVFLFFIAPWFTALDTTNPDGGASTYPGWPLLFFGWIGTLRILDGQINSVGWLANPLFVFGTLMFFTRQTKITFALLASAAIFSLTSYAMHEVPIDEAGNNATVVGFDIGFWLWVAAIWVNFLVALIMLVIPVRASQPKVDDVEFLS